MRSVRTHSQGFTLIELLVVVGMIAILFGLSSVNLVRPQNSASVQGAADTLVADLKSQQLLSMTGEDGQTTSPQPHGIVVAASQYTLFAGSSYSSSDANNFVVTLDAGLTITTSLPASQVIFSKGTGAVQGFVAGSNTIAVSNSSSGDQKTITINRYGAISGN